MKKEEEIEIVAELDSIDSPDNTVGKPLTIEPRKERHIVRNIFIILFTLAFLGAAGYVGWLLLKPLDPAPADTSPNSSTKPTTAELTAAAIIAELTPKMVGDVKTVLPNGADNPAKSYSAPVYKPTGYDFSVTATKESGFASYGANDVAKKDLAQIESTLESHDLVKTVLDPGSDIGIYASRFESDTIVCSVNDQKPYTADYRYSAVVGCADKSSYLTNAKALNPYYIVYAAESGNNTGQVAMGDPVLKASKTDGYSTMTIGISGSGYGTVGGFAGLFYKTPDDKIHFFRGTQSQIPCTDFNTPDIKKAYLGESCYEDNNEAATVKL